MGEGPGVSLDEEGIHIHDLEGGGGGTSGNVGKSNTAGTKYESIILHLTK